MKKKLPIFILILFVITAVILWFSKDQFQRIGCPCWDGIRNICLAEEACL